MLAGLLVVGLASVVSHAISDEHAATAVGLVFLSGTHWLAVHRSVELPRHFGLSLGGLLDDERLDGRRLVREFAGAFGWSALVALVILPPFVIGFSFWYGPTRAFDWLRVVGPLDAWGGPLELVDLYLGHLLVIALPEEAFFRGYLQTRLDDRHGTPVRLLGANIGWGLVISSLFFSVGHVLTMPFADRLAVFFPSLLFGWLRSRTGGIGASVFLHAHCNMCVAVLQKGFALG